MTTHGFDNRCTAWRDAGIDRVNCRDQPWFSQVPTVLRRTIVQQGRSWQACFNGEKQSIGRDWPITDGMLASGWGSLMVQLHPTRPRIGNWSSSGHGTWRLQPEQSARHDQASPWSWMYQACPAPLNSGWPITHAGESRRSGAGFTALQTTCCWPHHFSRRSTQRMHQFWAARSAMTIATVVVRQLIPTSGIVLLDRFKGCETTVDTVMNATW